MSAGANSLLPYVGGTQEETKDAIGITQFLSETNWYHIVGGLILQGGQVTAVPSGGTVTVDFNAAFPKQVLQIFLQSKTNPSVSASYANATTESFDIKNGAAVQDFDWFAIGV